MESTASAPRAGGEVPEIRPQAAAPPRERSNRLIRYPAVRWLAWAFWAVCLFLSVYIFLASSASRLRQLTDLASLNRAGLEAFGLSRDFLPPYVLALDTFTFLVYLSLGLLIFARKPRETLAHFASVCLITAGVTIVRPTDALFFVDPRLRLPILLIFAVGTGSILLFIFLFPDGRPAPRWMIWPVLLATALPIAGFAQQAYMLSTLHWPPPSLAILAFPGIALAVVAQIYRYRHVSSAAQQQQTKWVVFGLAIAAAGMFLFEVVQALIMPDVTRADRGSVLFLLFAIPLFYFSLAMVPISIGISIMRFRLWEIDLLLRRTLLYGIMTALMAGVFGAAIIFGQKILLTVTGQESDLAGFFAAVVVVAVFTPIKDYVKGYMDNRSKFGTPTAVKLKSLVAQVNARLSPVDAYQLVRRLTDEAVVAFNARGGAAYWEQENGRSMIYQTDGWDGDARLAAGLASPDEAGPIRMVALSARSNGKPYSPQDRVLLEEAAREIAHAIEQDRADMLAQGYVMTKETHA